MSDPKDQQVAGILAADRFIGEITQEPVNDERDAYHQSRALADLARWINQLAIDELVEQELEAVEIDDDTGPPYYNEALRRLYRIKNALRIALISRSQHQGLLEVS